MPIIHRRTGLQSQGFQTEVLQCNTQIGPRLRRVTDTQCASNPLVARPIQRSSIGTGAVLAITNNLDFIWVRNIVFACNVLTGTISNRFDSFCMAGFSVGFGAFPFCMATISAGRGADPFCMAVILAGFSASPFCMAVFSAGCGIGSFCMAHIPCRFTA